MIITMDDKFTLEELQQLFGEEIPIDAAKILLNETMSLKARRELLCTYSMMYKKALKQKEEILNDYYQE